MDPDRALSHITLLETEDEEEQSLYTISEYSNGTLSLTVSDGPETWSGKLSPEDLRKMADTVEMEEEEFVHETLQAFLHHRIDSDDYVYQATRNKTNKCLELVWKKNLAQENIRFTLGSVLLRPEANKRKMPQYIIEQHVALKEQLSDVKSDYASVAEDRRHLLKRLEQCVDLKEKLEKDLYGKFVLILNEKKAKIRQLLEEVSKYKAAAVRGRDRDTPPVEEVERMEGIEDPSTLEGEGEDNSGVRERESDDGSRTPSPKPKKFSAKLPSHSTAAAARRKPVPSSLLAEDMDNLHTSPPVRRRRREAGKKVSGQPEIPRPPSINRPRPRASEAKVRASSSSRERSESLESDDLLNLL